MFQTKTHFLKIKLSFQWKLFKKKKKIFFHFLNKAFKKLIFTIFLFNNCSIFIWTLLFACFYFWLIKNQVINGAKEST